MGEKMELWCTEMSFLGLTQQPERNFKCKVSFSLKIYALCGKKKWVIQILTGGLWIVKVVKMHNSSSWLTGRLSPASVTAWGISRRTEELKVSFRTSLCQLHSHSVKQVAGDQFRCMCKSVDLMFWVSENWESLYFYTNCCSSPSTQCIKSRHSSVMTAW